MERVSLIEKKVDSIKNEIGKMVIENIESLEEIKTQYEKKHIEYVKKIQEKLMESNIREKGLINVLEELQGTMNDSIRVLKCVTHEENVWFLIEENLEYEDNPPQYWIREIDLSPEEKEYLYQYLPLSMKEEDVLENDNANKQLKMHSDKFKELWNKRKEMLKELREIRFGLKISCY